MKHYPPRDAGYHPRIYDVPNEKLHIRIFDGKEDLWFPISWGELRCLVGDGFSALMREMHSLERKLDPKE